MLKKLASETAIYGVSSILSRLLNYVILTPYFTNVFRTGEYGVVTDMYVYAGLLLVLFTYRMETTFFRFGNDKTQLEKVFSTTAWSLIGTTLLFVVILLLSAQPLANWLQYPDNPDYVIWFIYIIALDALSVIPFARLRLENRPVRFAVLKTLGIIINILFVFLFLEGAPWLIQQGVSGLTEYFTESNRISFVFVANLLGSLVVLLFLLPEFKYIRFIFDRALWRQMIWYTMPLTVVGLAAVINQLISIPLMKSLLPYSKDINMEQIGIYGACYKIAILMSLFTQAFNFAAEPFFFRNANRTDARQTYAKVAQAFTLVGSLIFLGIMLYLDVIQYFIGKDFREGLAVVPLLLLAYLFLGIYYSFSMWYKLTDQTHFGATVSIIGVAITLALNVVLIPRIGYLGGAWAALGCYASMTILSYGLGQKYYPVDYPVGRMILYIGSAVLIYLAGNQLAGFTEGSMIGKMIVSTLLLMVWIGGIYFWDRESLRALVRS